MTSRPKRIAVVTGSPDYMPSPSELAELGRVLEDRDIEVVRTGGSSGVEAVVHAYVLGIWQRESWERSVGDASKHNAEMLGTPGVRLVVAFKGRGETFDCIKQAKKRGVDVYVISEGRW